MGAKRLGMRVLSVASLCLALSFFGAVCTQAGVFDAAGFNDQGLLNSFGAAEGRPSRLLGGRVSVIRDIPYVTGSRNPRQTLDLYLPNGDDSAKPLVVWIHGGAWKMGDKRGGPIIPLLSAGYAVASINYRLVPEVRFPEQVFDCKAAVRFLRAHASEYHIDPERIGAFGASAGGHLAALLGTSGGVEALEGKEGNLNFSSRVQAVCDWNGVSDVSTAEQQLRAIHGDPIAPEAIPPFLGGTVQEVPQKAREASPVTYAGKGNPPFLIMHGNRDTTVPIAQSQELQEVLKSKGVPVSFITVNGAKHGYFGRKERLMVVDFFDQHLRRAGAGGSAQGK